MDYRDWVTDTIKGDYFDFYGNDFAMKVFLELSWPAAKNYEVREKRVFVMYITNPVKEL